MLDRTTVQVAVIGGGPSGLMAAEALGKAGIQVDIYDAMPSFGRKFLLAGIGGLNITHDEAYRDFCTHYGSRQQDLQAILDRFPPSALRAWVHELGIDTFVGSSGRVFPAQMKAAPLLRAWLIRLRKYGVRLHARHRWLGWNADGSLRLLNQQGEISISPRATVLALGGASWPKLGSDGAWAPWLRERGVEIAPFESANCGFDVEWSEHLRSNYAGAHLKSVALTFTDRHGITQTKQGELVVSSYGVEGSLVYAFSRSIRESINAHGSATFALNLMPGRDAGQVLKEVSYPRGSRSLSTHLKSRLKLSGVKLALLYEVLGKDQMTDPSAVAAAIQSLPITVKAPRPLSEAISTAGGVRFEDLDERLMLKALPGTFIAGEMLDWEAPTGGYLLTGCFATGLWSGLGVRDWLDPRSSADRKNADSPI